MDLTADTPDPLDPVPEVTEGSVISSADRPIRSDRLSQRPSSPYPMGKSIGARVNESTGRGQASPRPRDETVYVRSLAARAARALGHLDGRITTNEVKLGDLDERVQGLAGEIQDFQLEVEGGKILDAERTRAFEAVIMAVENATHARREEITRIAREFEEARKAQQAADERQTHHEGVSTRLHANIEWQGRALAARAKALEQEMVNLRAQHAQDVQTLQQVIQQQANEQKASAEKTDGQMTQMMAMLSKLHSTPTHTTPAQPMAQELVEPEEPDRMQRWANESRAQEERGQGRRDKGKQPEGAPLTRETTVAEIRDHPNHHRRETTLTQVTIVQIMDAEEEEDKAPHGDQSELILLTPR